MKSAFLTLILLLLTAVCVQCSLSSEDNSAKTRGVTHPANNAAPTNAETNSQQQVIMEESESLMLQFLKRESLKLGIKNLSEAAPDGETELRIWVGFGLAYPRCFILKTLNGTHKAFYVAPKKNNGREHGDKSVRVLIESIPLDAPLSGWDEFDRFLKEQGIDYPIKLILDEKNDVGFDQELIVVEAKSEAQYSLVFFYLNTMSEDGQKALRVCRRLEQEFSVHLGCG